MSYVLIGVAAVIGLVLVVAATRPSTMDVRRSTSIQAPPDRIYPLIEDFHNWGSWSPWEKLDPAMKKTFSGATRGRGAIYEWDGNNKVGAGRMEITETTAPSRITVRLDFIRPMRNEGTTLFTIEPSGASSTVAWRMTGPVPFPSKVFGLFVNLDALIGKDFEEGLANLKALAES